MTGTERAQILVTARLLEAARTIDLLSTGLTLIAAFGVKNIAGVAVIAPGVVAKLYGFRVAFDARLFRDIAEEKLSSADLDAAFPKKAGRSWRDRCRGAKRLVIMLAAATLAQCLAIALR
ncbi:MAG TPA: hypothetical protein VGQ76_24565 [Thermoanaerobaculia bacterium]|nr:hypothetical protein [Thermoanaerobaculia bacterium]